jgi:Ca2+/Na+ antiporter
MVLSVVESVETAAPPIAILMIVGGFLFTFSGSSHKIDRLEGTALLLLYGLYLAFIVVRG